jgi:HPt (histidine-containing phosphotransfer) domain-containing protein
MIGTGRPGQGRGQVVNNASTASDKPIDRVYLARFTLNNADLEREVLELFAAQAPIYLQQLEAAATPKAWKDAAHTIKGSAAAVGAHNLARMAERAEQSSLESGRDHLAAIASAIEEARTFVAKLYAD